MIKLDVCLEAVFVDLPPEDRIAKIAQAGYDCVEFWFHDATFNGSECSTNQPKNAALLKEVCQKHGVTINNMVVNASDGSFGGSPVKAADLNKYLARLEGVIGFAKAVGCSKAITCSGNLDPSQSRTQMRDALQNALSRAAEIAEVNDFTLFLEPLNTHVDHAGYYLDSSSEGAEIVRAIGSPNLCLLYDVYHMQIMEGNIIANIVKNLDVIGHFHSAGVPGRGELFTGELDYPRILNRITAAGYQGRFGLEYFPQMDDHQESLRQTRAYLLGD